MNLREDAGETTDLAERESERAKEMQRRLAEWRESVEAKIPEPNPDFKPWREGNKGR